MRTFIKLTLMTLGAFLLVLLVMAFSTLVAPLVQEMDSLLGLGRQELCPRDCPCRKE